MMQESLFPTSFLTLSSSLTSQHHPYQRLRYINLPHVSASPGNFDWLMRWTTLSSSCSHKFNQYMSSHDYTCIVFLKCDLEEPYLIQIMVFIFHSFIYVSQYTKICCMFSERDSSSILQNLIISLSLTEMFYFQSVEKPHN